MPGCNAKFSGSESDVELPFAKPGDNDSEAEDEVRTMWRSWGLVELVYCPGRSCKLVGDPGADSVAPAIMDQSVCFLFQTRPMPKRLANE